MKAVHLVGMTMKQQTPRKTRGLITDPSLVVRVYDSGRVPISKVADHFGVHPRTIARHLENEGVYTKRPSCVPADQIEQMRELLDDGAPLAEVERTTGVTYKTIRRYFPGASTSPESRRLMAEIVQSAELARVHREVQRMEVDS